MTGHGFLEESLLELEQKGLNRKVRTLTSAQGVRIVIEGKDVLNFCSNDYLGLANDDRLKQAVISCIKEDGFGSGASRLVCGNMSAHKTLEEKIARFKNAQAAAVFSCGYMANLGIITAFFDRKDIIFSDKLNHASIVDGIRLSGATHRRYAHRCMVSLEQMLLKSHKSRRRLIVTDSVFSMDGDVAPLKDIVALAKKYDCLVMVDEAHAFGVMGKTGKGLVEHLDLQGSVDIQMGTFSKAAGSFGAYVCGSKALIALLINKARSFIYTTGMPPSVAAASFKAIEIIEEEKARREKLWANTNYLREELIKSGFDTMNSTTPIIPVLIKDNARALEFSKRLFEEGVLISAIRPPTVPINTARLRLTVTAEHAKSDLDFLLEKMQAIKKGMDINYAVL